ncbi:nitrate reductase associated protein [Paraburkholderia bonniea]|uniref:nitrate reductase associated protein n=1 Tax=Paraburkholderia bonniea TaxID=2152891 RepID=UPI001291CAB8|nr:nitrate reductase associated protein [Paraburkholderia bonniea]WJF90709.1 nitrate reductase associated protein [Paraburkholderia bonniea]WJF94022.1 nitrate reductase associated protein [Paraburkholderia bonniea]
MKLNAEPLLFNFEIASSQNLTFIPLAVRFNLDRCGLRISLEQWQQLPYAARQQLACYPVEDRPRPVAAQTPEFACTLGALLNTFGNGGAPEPFAPELAPAWRDTAAIPPEVIQQAALAEVRVPDAGQWAALAPFQRYVLAKLSRKPRANHDFIPALKEFGLLQQ